MVDVVKHRGVEAGTQGRQRGKQQAKNPGYDRDLGTGRGRKGEENRKGTHRKNQSPGAGRR